ncbi:hypothetical protein HCU01_04730 [Halomonas cupida]|uniref:Integrase catalytic domain-containing protein n=1 Tax=Halomonas cupida TaxID=44933 RepID=A0ABQ0WA93_9GAMM|nr:hypothetical protein HCU01_04730 [Halomonas cupida]
MKACSPQLGCRLIAECFNRQFAERRISVSKSYVAKVLCQSRVEVLRLRRKLKHRVPRPQPCNRTWGLDLTGKADASGRQRMILGLLDHGSRACLQLCVLEDKRSLRILRELITACRRFGMPKQIRVDNEACFNSMLLRTALAWLGIRLQTIAPHCPWQNGRIERFFGTLKQHLNTVIPIDDADLKIMMAEFRCWYNHAKPHQHLYGYTPAEVWEGRPKSTRTPQFISIWNGRINGWWFPP